MATEIERHGGEERERPFKCWAVFRGRDGFTGVVDTLTDHNLKVIRVNGVRSRKFRYRSHAVDWLTEQVLEERAAAGLAAEEDAYAVAHARELDHEERLRYQRREARRRMAAEAEAGEEGARRARRREAAEAAGLPRPGREEDVLAELGVSGEAAGDEAGVRRAVVMLAAEEMEEGDEVLEAYEEVNEADECLGRWDGDDGSE